MKKQNAQTLEAISVRRANIADADKVRYRVYNTPTEFIAVIAESALMAVKVAGIKNPHKIVRDLPTEGIAIEAKKMAEKEANPEQVKFSIEKTGKPEQIVAELPKIDPQAKQADFKPVTLKDLQPKGVVRARILSPELVSEIIDAHMKATAEATPSVPQPESSPSAEAKPEEVKASIKEPPAVKSAPTETNLSPDEVEKLLNG